MLDIRGYLVFGFVVCFICFDDSFMDFVFSNIWDVIDGNFDCKNLWCKKLDNEEIFLIDFFFIFNF